MFIKSCSSTPSLPKFAKRRITSSNCGRVSFEYAPRVLDIHVNVTASLNPASAGTLTLTIPDYFLKKGDHFRLIAVVPDTDVERDAVLWY